MGTGVFAVNSTIQSQLQRNLKHLFRLRQGLLFR